MSELKAECYRCGQLAVLEAYVTRDRDGELLSKEWLCHDCHGGARRGELDFGPISDSATLASLGLQLHVNDLPINAKDRHTFKELMGKTYMFNEQCQASYLKLLAYLQKECPDAHNALMADMNAVGALHVYTLFWAFNTALPALMALLQSGRLGLDDLDFLRLNWAVARD